MKHTSENSEKLIIPVWVAVEFGGVRSGGVGSHPARLFWVGELGIKFWCMGHLVAIKFGWLG